MAGMNIEYVARHFQLNDELRDHAEQKLTKAIKFLEEPIEIRVTLDAEKHRKIAEISAAHRYGLSFRGSDRLSRTRYR